MLLQKSIEHVSIVYTCNTYFVLHWSVVVLLCLSGFSLFQPTNATQCLSS